MSSLLDFDTLNTLASLYWAHTGNSEAAEKMLSVLLIGKIWGNVTADQELESLRTQTILEIAKYVKNNPKASKEQLAAEIGKHITEFAEKVKTLH